MTNGSDARLATSRYTFRVPLADGYALFNASTGSVTRLAGADAEELAALLSGPPRPIPEGVLDEGTTDQLRRAGFLVDPGLDEVAAVRERYWTARGKAPVSLVVTTTMDCNLGCYYCFESRSGEQLRADDVGELVEVARERLGRGGKRSLHVDWYGGEPLLNVSYLERASLALQEFCAAEGVSYHASVVSNGTRWPEDLAPFVARHRIRQVQISFDGLKENHDRRRRYRREYRTADGVSSFEQAVRVVDGLLRCTRVDLRFNADHGNVGDFPGFVALARERGWFDAPFRCVIMVAKLSAYSERSAFMRPHELTPEEFDALQALARELLPAEAQDKQDVSANGFPYPKTSVCGALAPDSAVIGADGLEYRCGLQVGETHHAVGRVRTTLPLVAVGTGPAPKPTEFPERAWWDAFDPTRQPSCSRCSFLPVCWGGCPKRHLDASRVDVENEGHYWRTNLPRLIASGFGQPVPEGFALTEDDQFRTGRPPAPAAG
ncbi:radical SAM protein [Streptomyces sp. G45]|uniref:radical SAM protein n=1 Tax=Streptomyces sp. G45 TaxID=3406627 RepID=UPI003C1E4CF1